MIGVGIRTFASSCSFCTRSIASDGMDGQAGASSSRYGLSCPKKFDSLPSKRRHQQSYARAAAACSAKTFLSTASVERAKESAHRN